VQQCAQRAGILRHARRLLHLAEDLRLAQHHRIQAAGDAEHVAHRVAAGQGVQVGGDFLRLQPMVIGQPLRRRLGRRPVQYSSVRLQVDRIAASRTECGRASVRPAPRAGARIERHLLAHGQRRGVVIEAKGIKLHRTPFAAEFSKEIIALANRHRSLTQINAGREQVLPARTRVVFSP
jgi:hypothetical protein